MAVKRYKKDPRSGSERDADATVLRGFAEGKMLRVAAADEDRVSREVSDGARLAGMGPAAHQEGFGPLLKGCAMQVHIFRGTGRVFAFTADSAGSNLPPRYAPWTAVKTVDMQKDVPIPGVDVNDCLRDLEAHGVHVTDAHVRITEDAIR